jgi:hypothetical protein
MVHGLETLVAMNDRAVADASPSLADEKFDQWAIVDVMGHQRYVGRVTEQVIAGCGFIRVDVPNEDGSIAFTKLIGTASIYAISPVQQDVALQMNRGRRPTPIEAYALPQPKAQPAMTRDPDEYYDDGHDDDDGSF